MCISKFRSAFDIYAWLSVAFPCPNEILCWQVDFVKSVQFWGDRRHPISAANTCIPEDPSKFLSPNSWQAVLQDAAASNYKYINLWRASPITLPTSNQILNDPTALLDEGNTTQVLLEPFTDGIPNRIGNEADLGKQEHTSSVGSWLIGEAVTDPLLHWSCFFWVLFPRMNECSSNTCVMGPISEPNIKPGQLKRSFTRMLIQLHLLSRWIACFLFCPLLFILFPDHFGIGWTTAACVVTSFCRKRDHCLPLNWAFLILQIAKSTPFALIIFNSLINIPWNYVWMEKEFFWHSACNSFYFLCFNQIHGGTIHLFPVWSCPVSPPDFIHKALGFKHHPAPCAHSPSP